MQSTTESATGGLRACFHEECRLESLFAELARQARTREQRYKLSMLSWLQTTTVSCITDFLGSAAMASPSQSKLDIDARKEASVRFADGWSEVLGGLEQGARQRAQVYAALERRGLVGHNELRGYLIAHASAQIEFASLEARGARERSLDPIIRLLELPAAFADPEVSNDESRV